MKKIVSKKLSFKRIKVAQLSRSSGGTWGQTNYMCPSVQMCEQYEGEGGSGSGYEEPDVAPSAEDSCQSGFQDCLECRVRRNNTAGASGG